MWTQFRYEFCLSKTRKNSLYQICLQTLSFWGTASQRVDLNPWDFYLWRTLKHSCVCSSNCKWTEVSPMHFDALVKFIWTFFFILFWRRHSWNFSKHFRCTLYVYKSFQVSAPVLDTSSVYFIYTLGVRCQLLFGGYLCWNHKRYSRTLLQTVKDLWL